MVSVTFKITVSEVEGFNKTKLNKMKKAKKSRVSFLLVCLFLFQRNRYKMHLNF